MKAKRPSTAGASGRARKPFVRGEAEKTFREAFDGKSLDEVLFRAQFAEKHLSTEMSGTGGDPLGRETMLHKVALDAAKRAAGTLQKRFGHAAVNDTIFRMRPKRAAVPPSDRMNFIPFANWKVPAGVVAPKIPHMRTTNLAQESVVSVDHLTWKEDVSLDRALPDGFFDAFRRGPLMERMERDRTGPINQGKLWSYHRPY
jgi:hypothetical protein